MQHNVLYIYCYSTDCFDVNVIFEIVLNFVIKIYNFYCSNFDNPNYTLQVKTLDDFMDIKVFSYSNIYLDNTSCYFLCLSVRKVTL